MMRTFSITTLGCKVNQYEGQQIRELLERRGLRPAEGPQEPDLVVVHTCCVTHTASAKSRQCIRKALRQSRRAGTQSRVLVSGCLPAAQNGEWSGLGRNVQRVSRLADLAATLTRWAETNPPGPCPNTPIKPYNAHKSKHKNQTHLPLLTAFKHQTRAFLKLQDGCDAYCTYCIVPKTRPVVRSKPADAAIREAQALVKSGHKEIVVSGVFLGAYGQKSVRRNNWPDRCNHKLADLLDRMAQISGLARIRLSSLEPADVTERLLDTLCSHRNIMPHLHLALQSGSDAVLRRMARQYRIDEFRRTVDSIQTRLDRPAITTDIIVGFPGETDEDFEQTVQLAKSVGFAKMHVFTFSPRRGTPAAGLHDRLEKKLVKTRSQILRDLDIELGRRYRRQFIGEIAEILIETHTPWLCGRTERYFRVYLKKNKPSTRTAGKRHQRQWPRKGQACGESQRRNARRLAC